MFFFLSKVLSFFLQPLSWVFTLLILSFVVKKPKIKKRFLISAIAVLFVFSNPFIFNVCSYNWEVELTDPLLLEDTFDVAIVLGGIVKSEEDKNQLQFASNSDRILMVLPLYFSGKVKKILISGGSGNLSQDEIEADVLAKYLYQLGVNPRDIIQETKSRNTYENAKFSAEILKEGFPSAKFLLSTSSTHMKRSLSCFKKQGIECTPFSVDKINRYSDFDLSHLLIPQPYILSNWYWLIHEWIGMLIYKLYAYC